MLKRIFPILMLCMIATAVQADDGVRVDTAPQAADAVLVEENQAYPTDFKEFDYQTALRYSQSAIGRKVSDYSFTNTEGKVVKLSDYAGRPLLIQMVFTSCYYICSTATKNLDRIVQVARNSLGDDSFNVLTIGFDTAVDSPQAMKTFAHKQGVNLPRWDFLSTDAETIQALSKEIGFIYFASPRGFDHLTQVTVLDQDGVVYQQAYGEAVSTPLLVEPLKQLVFNTRTEQTMVETLGKRVRLFCTLYDPKQDRYYFDYSLFVGIVAGLTVIFSVIWFLLREFVFRRRRTPPG